MRISDILPTGKERQAPVTPLIHPRTDSFRAAPAVPAEPSAHVIDEDYYFKKFESEQKSAQPPVEVYGRLIQTARMVCECFTAVPARTPDLEALCASVEHTMRATARSRSAMLELAERSTPEDHLIGHIANVTIFSIAAAQHLGWPASTQLAVGVGALLHDAGLIRRQQDYLKARIFTQEERLIWNQYVGESEELLQEFIASLATEPREIVQSIVLQSQERNNGQGFPKHLTRDQISPEARLVGLCDTYESFTHSRPYRGRKLPFEALRLLMEYSGDLFDGSLIKALRETLTIFPPGSYVKLSSGEVARVTDLNRKLPVRPIVKIVVDAEGRAVRSDRVVDLAEIQDLSIEKPVDECDLPLSDPSLILELRTRRWWLG